MVFNVVTFVITMAVNYVLSRLTATDGPKLENKEAAGGEYGIPKPRLYGAKCRITAAFIAMDDIKETKHKAGGNQTLIGAGMGAATGFIVAGPVGAVIGGALGGLFGSATQSYYYTYSDTFAVLFADRTDQQPIEGVSKIWANGKLIFKHSESTVVSETLDADGKLIRRKYKKNKYFKSLTIYGGSVAQTVDPILEDKVDEDCAYIYSGYAVFEDLQLAPFGQSVPPTEFLVDVDSDQSLASTAEAIVGSAGIDFIRDVSTTALNDDLVRGFALTSETSCWDALKPLLPAFGSDCADIGGQLRFYKRSQFMRSSITLDEMGAYQYGDSPPEDFTFTRGTDLKLPQELALTFIDPDRDYSANTATSSRSEGSAQSNVSINLPLVLTADEGASTAALMHWDAWLGRTAIRFSLTDAWISLGVGLAYGIPFAERTIPYRITRRLRGANAVHEVEGVSDESVTYTANVAGASGETPDDESTLFPDTRPILMDMPIISDDHDEYGFYVAMGASDPFWTRGRIEATANGTVWAVLVDSPQEAIVGDVTGTLAAGSTTGLDDTLDTTTVLTVVLTQDGYELTEASDADLDAWKNFIYVGKNGHGEYLQFKTPTKVAPKTWELTNLRRGRRGTDYAIGTHASGEEFVLVDAGVYRIVYSSPDDWGDVLQVRGITLHQDDDDVTSQNFTNTGEGKRPFSPVNVEGVWDGSYNLTATFDSRSRLFAGGLGIDDNAEWEVVITNATPDRTIVVTAETFDYSAADQTSDGLTPGDSIIGKVRQTSDVNDGRYRDFTLIGPNDALMLEDDITFLELEDDSTVFELG